MRRTGDIFEQESYRGEGSRNMLGVSLAMIICSLISVLAAIFIIVNFKAVTVRIAIFMVNLLSSGALILVVVIVVIYLIMRLKWKMRRRFGDGKEKREGLSDGNGMEYNKKIYFRMVVDRSTSRNRKLCEI